MSEYISKISPLTTGHGIELHNTAVVTAVVTDTEAAAEANAVTAAITVAATDARTAAVTSAGTAAVTSGYSCQTHPGQIFRPLISGPWRSE